MKINRSEHVPYSPSQMFDLVNDIEAYPKFLEWCATAKVENRFDRGLEATIGIGFKGVNKSFTTRNRLDRPHRIDMELLDGPFSHLEGAWIFSGTTGVGSEVRLALNFQVTRSPFSRVFALLFEDLVRSQIKAFSARAKELYGEGKLLS